MNLIDLDKQYQTRSGLKVVNLVHRTWTTGTFSLAGTIVKPNTYRKSFRFQIWKPDGSFMCMGKHELDLIPI